MKRKDSVKKHQDIKEKKKKFKGLPSQTKNHTNSCID